MMAQVSHCHCQIILFFSVHHPSPFWTLRMPLFFKLSDGYLQIYDQVRRANPLRTVRSRRGQVAMHTAPAEGVQGRVLGCLGRLHSLPGEFQRVLYPAQVSERESNLLRHYRVSHLLGVGSTLILVFHHLARLPSRFCQIPISPGRIGQTVEHSKF